MSSPRGLETGSTAARRRPSSRSATITGPWTSWTLELHRDPELSEAFLGRARTYFLLGRWDLGLGDLEQAAAWAHGDPRIEAAVASAYLRCLPRRPDRLPRLLVHIRRAAGDFWHTLDARYHLAAGMD